MEIFFLRIKYSGLFSTLLLPVEKLFVEKRSGHHTNLIISHLVPISDWFSVDELFVPVPTKIGDHRLIHAV